MFIRIPLAALIDRCVQSQTHVYVLMCYCVFHIDLDFIDLIQYCFCRERRTGVLGDIYDGSAYAKHSDFFECQYNLSFALNFD